VDLLVGFAYLSNHLKINCLSGTDPIDLPFLLQTRGGFFTCRLHLC
jgi:hypothetical protein